MNNTPLSNYFHLNLCKDENNSHKKPFTSGQISAKFRTAVLNQTASREKLNNQKANSTPNRAFFVRSFRTPKINPAMDLFSMVGRNGHVFNVASLPFELVSHSVTLYRLNREKFCGSLINLSKGLSAMIYQFLCVNRNTKPYLEEVVQVQAINEDEARWQLTAEHALLATVGRYPDHQTQQATDRTARLNARLLAKFCPNRTVCEAQGFTTAENGDNIAGTTTNNGHRTRQTCGFFTSQNSHNGRNTPIYAEFGARLICGNKARNRTNNASRLLAVVETLPHPIQGEANPFTKTNKRLFQMKTPTPQANTAQNLPLIPHLFARFEGVIYA